jgi:hypothetical protein
MMINNTVQTANLDMNEVSEETTHSERKGIRKNKLKPALNF